MPLELIKKFFKSKAAYIQYEDINDFIICINKVVNENIPIDIIKIIKERFSNLPQSFLKYIIEYYKKSVQLRQAQQQKDDSWIVFSKGLEKCCLQAETEDERKKIMSAINDFIIGKTQSLPTNIKDLEGLIEDFLSKKKALQNAQQQKDDSWTDLINAMNLRFIKQPETKKGL